VIDVYARVRKPRAKHDLHACHFATIPANWDAPDGYIESIVWLSEDEFVAKRGDVTWRQRRFNIAECKVDYYN
ncbi:MAG: hypothetical protein J6X44_04790, partial [Thermoguttaceae bacterium]|nr:hypothetical protein [Thermoguttaceae bacterium]